MERELEIFMYDIGGSFDIRIYLNLHFPKIQCTMFWVDGEISDSRDFYPIDYTKVLGTFNQYLIGLGLNNSLPNPAIYRHMEEMTKFMKLINTVTFEKLAKGVLCKFLNVVQDGTKIWVDFLKSVPDSFPKKECKRILTLYSRYLIMYHLLLWEHVHVEDGMTVSPLWSK